MRQVVQPRMVGEPVRYKDALLPCVLIPVLCSSRSEPDVGSKIDLTDVVMATSSPEASNSQHSEGTVDSEMTSEVECSGGCHVAGEDVAVCRSSEPSEAVTAARSTNSELAVSAANVSLQQSEIAICEMADSTARNTDASCASVSDLPDEILLQIFSHLSFSDLVNVVQKVCSRWKCVSQDLDLWTDKEFQIRYWNTCDSHTVKGCKTDQEAIQTFCDVPSLRKLTMHRGATFRVFRALYNGCPRLSELRLCVNQKLSYSVLKNLVEKCSGIHTLEICNDQLKTEKFSELVSSLQHLRVLELDTQYSSEIKPVLKPLGDGCPRLEDVNFRGVTVDMDDLRYFLNAKRNTLKSIRIKWTMVGKRCVLPLLVVCADTLERLELFDYDVVRDEAREAFTALGSLKNLRELRMQVIDPPPHRTAARAFNTGVGLPNLTLLDLREGHGLDDDTILAISRGCPALQELVIREAERLTDAAFSQMYRLKRLEKLEVSCCGGLSGALIPCLARIPRLLTLVLEELEFPKLQPGLSSILEFSGLRCLTLNSCLITGLPFDQFPEKLVSLRELNYVWCRGDPNVAEGLAERMPGVKICGNIEEEEEEDQPEENQEQDQDEEQEQGDAQQEEGQNEENAEEVRDEHDAGPGDAEEEDGDNWGHYVEQDSVAEILDNGTLSLLFLEDT